MKIKNLKVFLGFLALLTISLSCTEQMEDKENAQKEFPQMLGSWQLNDIIFLSPPADPQILQNMETGKASILQQIVKMTFKEDFTVIENVNGKLQNGSWNITSDSIVSVKFTGQTDANVMILRDFNENQLRFVIGTPEDRSLYVFKKVEL